MIAFFVFALLYCAAASHDNTPDLEDECPKNPGGKCFFQIHSVRARENFGEMAEERGFTTAAELGVQSGRFSDMFLYVAPSMTSYTLVDTWAHQANYSDSANVDDGRQEKLYQKTMNRLQPYVDADTRNLKLVPIRNFTTNAVLEVKDESFDFIYVDARHDFLGVKEDIELWYPKLKVGGIMAGDDYLTAKEQLQLKGGEYDINDDWGICFDGSRHDGAVKGAVKQFAKKHGIKVYSTWKHDVTPKEKQVWPQWIYSRKVKVLDT